MAKIDINVIKEYYEKNRQQAILFGVAGGLLVVLLLVGLIKLFSGGSGDEMMTADGSAPAAPFSSPGYGPPGITPGGPPGPPGASPTSPMAPGGQPAMPSTAPTPIGGPAPPMAGGPPMGAPASDMVPSSTEQSLDPNQQAQNLDPNQAPVGGDMSAPAAKKATKEKLKSLYSARPDPFAPPGLETPEQMRRRRAEYMAKLEEAQLRAQMATLPNYSIWRPKSAVPQTMDPTLDPTSQQTPVVRRVAGLLYGERVLGVLETDGKSSVVKPGDVLVSGTDRVKVTRIDRTGILLKKLDTKSPGTIKVPLKSAPEGSVTAGMPGMSGMPYGPRMPGGPPMGPRAGGPPLPME